MRNTMIAAATALSLLGIQAAYADSVQRYQTGISLQHMAAPQQARPYAQAEQTGANNGRFRQAQAEQTGANEGSFRQAQAEQHPQYGQAEAPHPQYAMAEQGDVKRSSYILAAAEATGVDNASLDHRSA